MWPLGSKKHFRYKTVRDWIVRERIPVPLTGITDKKTRDRYIQSLAELQERLCKAHVLSLADNEQQLINNAKHPSQCSSNLKAAEPYRLDFLGTVSHLNFVKSVELVSSHFDTCVLLVRLTYDPGLEALHAVPELYRGFTVRLDVDRYNVVKHHIASGPVNVDEVIALDPE